MIRAEWQRGILALIRSDIEANESDEPEDPFGPPAISDFGFWHDIKYVRRAIHFLRNFSLMPSQWIDEEESWFEDMDMYASLEARLRWEVKNGAQSDEDIEIDEDSKLLLGR